MKTLEVNQEFEALLNYLKHSHGCDLTNYRRSTLMRRFQQRMQQVKVENYEKYLQYLQKHDEEVIILFKSVLINYTGFFRDREAWDYLAKTIIPQIIASKQPDEKIRVWSAGCASGQEVYSLAILLAEALGSKQYLQRVQIYATDLDEKALQQARKASYSHQKVADIPANLLEKYFEPTKYGYVFHSQLRRTIVFGHHNLAEDAPISKVDLLTCRNVLMYFQAETQTAILTRFHFALKNEGFLFLGNAETFVNSRQIFIPTNLKHRLFIKGQNLDVEDHLLLGSQTGKNSAVGLWSNHRIWQTAFESSQFAQVAVDLNGYLVVANEQAKTLFKLTQSDLGRYLRELELGKLVGSYTYIRLLCENRHSINLKYVEWATSKGKTYWDICITPILAPSGTPLGANFTFTDSTRNKQLEDELKCSKSKLAKISEELEKTKTALETTRVELQSAQKEVEVMSLLGHNFYPNSYRIS